MSLQVGELYAALTVDDAQFTAGLARGERAMDRAGQHAEQVSKRVEQSMTQLGLRMTAVGIAGAAGLAMIGKAAIDFESSFAGVRKTVDATEKEFGEMAQGLRDMAKEMPVNVNELNKIAEAGGQLGIAKESLLDFTETAAMLGATTNLASDEAATGLARLSNVLQILPSDFDNLGATLVDLGNKGASTESEILQMSLRIAGAGNTIGLSADQVLGFANALSSVGIEAEMGGSSISRIMIEVAKSVATGDETLSAFASTAGMSADAFAQAWKDDAAGALITFIEGLGEVQAAGGPVFQILDQLGLDTIRVGDTLLRAAGAGDLMRESLANGATAWQQNTALTEEAGRRFETTASQIQILENHVNDLMISFGSTMLPTLNDVVGGLVSVAEAFEGLPEPVQATVAQLGMAATGIALFGGGLLLVIPQIAATMRALEMMGITAGMLPGMLMKASVAAAALYAAMQVLPGAVQNFREAFGGMESDQARVNQTMQGFLDLNKQTTDADIISERAINNLQRTREAMDALGHGIDDSLIASLDTGAGYIDAVTFGMLGLDDATKNTAESLKEQRSDIEGTIAALEQMGFSYDQVVAILEAGGFAVESFSAQLAGLKARQDEMAAVSWGDAIREQFALIDSAGANIDTTAAKIELLAQKIGETGRFFGTSEAFMASWNTELADLIKQADLTEPEVEALIGRLKELNALPADVPMAEELFRTLITGSADAKAELEELIGVDLGSFGEEAEDASDKAKKAFDSLTGAVQSLLPAVDETFAEWQQRLVEQAQAYVNFERNLSVILDALVQAHVAQPGMIAAAIAQGGPLVTQAMAYHLAEQGVDAVVDELGLLGDAVSGGADAMIIAALQRSPDWQAAAEELVLAGVLSADAVAAAGGAQVGNTFGANLASSMANTLSGLFGGGGAIDIAAAGDKGAGFQLRKDVAAQINLLQQQAAAAAAAGTRAAGGGPVRTGGGGGGSGGSASTPKEKTAEEIVLDAARAAESIADAMDRSMEVFDKLGDFEGEVDFGAMQRLRDATVQAVTIFGDGINEASLTLVENAGKWSENASKVVGVIGVGVENLMALEEYEAPSRERLLSFIEEYRFAAEEFSRRIPAEGAATSEAAAEWAEHASKVTGVIASGVADLEALKDYAPLVRLNLTRFVLDYIYASEVFSSMITIAVRSTNETAADWAGHAGNVTGVIKGGVEAFEALTDYAPLTRLNLTRFALDYIFAAEVFSSQITIANRMTDQTAADWAENADKVISVIEGGVSGFEALSEYRPLIRANLTQFANDYVAAVRQLADEIREANFEVGEDLAKWADEADSIVGLIGDGVDAFEALRRYRTPSLSRIAEFAVQLVITVEMVNDQINLAVNTLQRIEPLDENVKKWRDAAGDTVALVRDGIESLSMLEDFKPVSLSKVTQVADEVVAMVSAINDRIAEAISSQRPVRRAGGGLMFPPLLTDEVVEWVDNAQKFVALVGDAVTAFEGLRDFKAVPGERITELMDALDQAARDFVSRSTAWDMTLTEDAGKLAGSASEIVGAIGAGFDAFAKAKEITPGMKANITELIAFLGEAIAEFSAGVAHIDAEQAAATATLAGAGSNVLGAVVALVNNQNQAVVFGQAAQERAKELGRTLRAIMVDFAEGASEFAEGEAQVTKDLGEATANIVGSFQALQGEIQNVNLQPVRKFSLDLLQMFDDITARAEELKDRRDVMDWIDDIVEWMKKLGGQFGITFPTIEVKPPPPKPTSPTEPDPDNLTPEEREKLEEAKKAAALAAQMNAILATLIENKGALQGMDLKGLGSVLDGFTNLLKLGTEMVEFAGLNPTEALRAGKNIGTALSSLLDSLGTGLMSVSPTKLKIADDAAETLAKLSGSFAFFQGEFNLDRSLSGIKAMESVISALASVARNAAAIDVSGLNAVANTLGRYASPQLSGGPQALGSGQGTTIVYNIAPKFEVSTLNASDFAQEIPALAGMIVSEIERQTL